MTTDRPESGENPLPIESQDDAVLRMLGGATFHAGLTLPSGRSLDSDEANAFTSAFADETPDARHLAYLDADEVMEYYVRRRRDENPLSSENDRWTGDPDMDRQMLVGRAIEARYHIDRRPVADSGVETRPEPTQRKVNVFRRLMQRMFFKDQ